MPKQTFPALINSLLSAERYPHPVWDIQVIETHISWVILTGEIAYKIKKPVDFGFLDFSTLEKRHAYCELELLLNRRLAHSLYVDVVPITGTSQRPWMGGAGEAIEYAVKMWQFDGARLAGRLLQNEQLTAHHFDELAGVIARFHDLAGKTDSAHPRGGSLAALRAVDENLGLLRSQVTDSGMLQTIEDVSGWCRRCWSDLAEFMDQRKAAGLVRECHGDLHLANLVEWQGQLVAFDCIEFNEDLRWIDVQSEIAFLIMDLEVCGQRRLAWHFANTYLDITGDYRGLRLLRYFLVYRAAVRAKIAWITRSQSNSDSVAEALLDQFRRYMAYCKSMVDGARPCLFVTVGLSGSGKSTVAAALAERLPAVRLRSDVERKRMAAEEGLTVDGWYTPEMGRRTYQRLQDLAGDALAGGFNVILDATFLKKAWRDQAVATAFRNNASCVLLQVMAGEDQIRERIQTRLNEAKDPSDADLAVLEKQLSEMEGLDSEERLRAVIVDTSGPLELDALAEQCTKLANSLRRSC